MFYTNRRANVPGLSGVAWVHGTPIGIAESRDGGITWKYAGDAHITVPPDIGGTEPTFWAPDVIAAPEGGYHMFLTVVPGIRPADAASHDQKRVATPKAAVAAGADILVIGRAITGAADPAQAAHDILQSLA